MGKERQKQRDKTATSQRNAKKIKEMSGMERRLGNIFKKDGTDFLTGSLKQSHALAGATKELWRHEPADGDQFRGNHTVGNAYTIRNETTALDLITLHRTGEVTLNPSPNQFADTHMQGAFRTGSQGDHTLRRIGGDGSALSSAAANHSHGSINFNSQYTDEERRNTIRLEKETRRLRNLKQYEALRPFFDLVLDLTRQLTHEVDMTAAEKQQRLDNDPAYRHEFLMKHDQEYFAAWMLEQNPDYRQKASKDRRIVNMAANARSKHGTIESDPELVREFNRKFSDRL
jgi:hypothetical protein